MSKQNRFKPQPTWVDVYHIFMEIADTILSNSTDHDEAHKLICYEVDKLYAQHEGEPLWDSAYARWIAPSDDDEEAK